METICGFLRKCLFKALSVGPIPSHVAFIMDGNRRYAKRRNLVEGDGHRAGFSSLMTILGYCYDLGIRYVTVHAFSIDNFKRRPDEVQCLMDLMVEKIEELLKTGSVLDRYGIRIYFIGNLRLLNGNVRIAAEKAMKATASNNKTVLLICVAYTSRDEIVNAVESSCEDKLDEADAFEGNEDIKGMNGQLDEPEVLTSPSNCGVKRVEGAEMKNGIFKHVEQGSHQEKTDDIEKMHKYPIIKSVDIEENMYMAVAPDPDIVIRSSGETRLSNFLLWQTAYCPLYAPDALWPDMGLWHLVWAVLSFQRSYLFAEEETSVKPSSSRLSIKQTQINRRYHVFADSRRVRVSLYIVDDGFVIGSFKWKDRAGVSHESRVVTELGDRNCYTLQVQISLICTSIVETDYFFPN